MEEFTKLLIFAKRLEQHAIGWKPEQRERELLRFDMGWVLLPCPFKQSIIPREGCVYHSRMQQAHSTCICMEHYETQIRRSGSQH